MILGIDPGLANLGWAVLDDGNLVDYGCVETRVEIEAGLRLQMIYKELERILSIHKIKSVSVESLYFAKNAKSAIKVAEVMGVIRLCANNHQIRLVEYTPLQIKMALVGYGRASKDQVEDMVKRLLGLKNPIKPDHASDAVAVAITYMRYNLL